VSPAGGQRAAPRAGWFALAVLTVELAASGVWRLGGLPDAWRVLGRLEGAASHPAAIGLHALADGPVWGAALTASVALLTALLLEPRIGWRRSAWLFVAGTLAGGAVYFALAQLVPELAGYPLLPIGGLAAWAAAARATGRQTPPGTWTARGLQTLWLLVLLAAVGVYFVAAQRATAWLLAALVGMGVHRLGRDPRTRASA